MLHKDTHCWINVYNLYQINAANVLRSYST